MHALTELQWHGNYGIRAVAYPQYIYIFMNAIYLYIHECSLGVHNAPKEFMHSRKRLAAIDPPDTNTYIHRLDQNIYRGQLCCAHHVH
jgi:hypothetical protein